MSLLVVPEQGSIKNSMAGIVARFEHVLEPSHGFFLKPNIVFPVTPDTGEITRPTLVRSLIEVLRERFGDVDIVVAEGTAAGTLAEDNFKVSGYARLCKEMSVELVDLDLARRVKVPWRYGAIELPEIAFRRTYINLPILKMSTAAVLSGAIKNQKGLITSSMKKKFHRMGLHGPLAALTVAIQPQLTILDCINFLKRRNVFVAGEKIFEIDALAIRVLNCEEPEYFRFLSDQGFAADGVVEGEEFIGSGWCRHRADRHKRLLGIRLWSNPRACSVARLMLRGIRGNGYGRARVKFALYAKLLRYGFLGADFVFGAEPHFSARSKRVICIGDCTKKLAEKEGYRHVPGCPPTAEDMIRFM